MAKRLLALAGALAALLVAAVPAFAQQETAQQYEYGGEEVSVTGVVEDFGSAVEGSTQYGMRDEATGLVYYLAGDFDFGSLVGQTVTATGTTEEVLRSVVLNVSQIGPASGPAGDDATLNFELAVEGEPPADATFFGNVQTGEGGPGLFVQLVDPDGDGLYTGTTTLPDRFAPGPRPVPPGVEPVSLPVQIVQGTGTRSTGSGTFPGEPISVIRDFGVVPMEEENAFSASVSFGGGVTTAPEETTGGTTTAYQYEDGGAPAGGVDLNEDGAVDEADAELAAQTSEAGAEATPESGVLPDTGGALLLLPLAGLVLVALGLLARRTTR